MLSTHHALQIKAQSVLLDTEQPNEDNPSFYHLGHHSASSMGAKQLLSHFASHGNTSEEEHPSSLFGSWLLGSSSSHEDTKDNALKEDTQDNNELPLESTQFSYPGMSETISTGLPDSNRSVVEDWQTEANKVTAQEKASRKHKRKLRKERRKRAMMERKKMRSKAGGFSGVTLFLFSIFCVYIANNLAWQYTECFYVFSM